MLKDQLQHDAEELRVPVRAGSWRVDAPYVVRGWSSFKTRPLNTSRCLAAGTPDGPAILFFNEETRACIEHQPRDTVSVIYLSDERGLRQDRACCMLTQKKM